MAEEARSPARPGAAACWSATLTTPSVRAVPDDSGSASLPPVPRIKPFRALRYDPSVAGPLATVVAPPHDVISEERREQLLAVSPYNVVRLIRPADVAEA